MKKFFSVLALLACVFSVNAADVKGFCITNLTMLPEGLEQLQGEEIEDMMNESGMDMMFINTVSLDGIMSYERIASLQELQEQGTRMYKDLVVSCDKEKGILNLSTNGQDDIMIGISFMEDGTLLVTHAGGIFELKPNASAFILVSTNGADVNMVRMDISALWAEALQ